MYFEQLELGPMQNFVYLLGEGSSGNTIAIDPAWEQDTIIDTLGKKGRVLSAVILTHAHYDHSNDINDLTSKYNIPVYVRKEELDRGIAERMPGFFVIPEGRNISVIDSDGTLELCGLKVNLIHTPGHSRGSQCIHVEDILLSGDTLFVGACGRTDLPGGDPGELTKSLKKLVALFPDNTKIYPGHNYADRPSSTFGEEKETNIFLRL